MIGVAMVTMVSFLAVLEHHMSTVDPGPLLTSLLSIYCYSLLSLSVDSLSGVLI